MDEKMNLAVNETEGELTQEDVLDYLQLLDRKVWLMDQQYGDKWKPEYVLEMDTVDKCLFMLRKRVAAAVEARDARRAQS